MTDEEILRKAIERAVENGYCDEGLINLTFYNSYFAFIFSHSFARALNFKLADLGAWCDEGKEPLRFIEKLIENDYGKGVKR